MTAENRTMSELVALVAARCFDGVLPNHPEAVALAVVETCLPDERTEDLETLMNEFIPAIEARLADQDTRARRVAELNEEIRALRGKINRSLRDEKILLRIYAETPEREAERTQLQAERELCESALWNLLKEKRELEGEEKC
jgi:hypothetical protein